MFFIFGCIYINVAVNSFISNKQDYIQNAYIFDQK